MMNLEVFLIVANLVGWLYCIFTVAGAATVIWMSFDIRVRTEAAKNRYREGVTLPSLLGVVGPSALYVMFPEQPGLLAATLGIILATIVCFVAVTFAKLERDANLRKGV